MQVEDRDDQRLKLLAALSVIQRGGVIKAIAQICAVRISFLWFASCINQRAVLVKLCLSHLYANWHPIHAAHAVEGVPEPFRFFSVRDQIGVHDCQAVSKEYLGVFGLFEACDSGK